MDQNDEVNRSSSMTRLMSTRASSTSSTSSSSHQWPNNHTTTTTNTIQSQSSQRSLIDPGGTITHSSQQQQQHNISHSPLLIDQQSNEFIDISTMINSEPNTQKPARLCGFCHCANINSDELIMFEGTPGIATSLATLIANVKQEQTRLGISTLTIEAAFKAHFQMSHNISLDEAIFINKDVANVGWSRLDDSEHNLIFDEHGHVWAHKSCAKWSHDVYRDERDPNLILYVDKAVLNALTTKCNICLNYGASIPCAISSCNKRFHLQCAAISGAFQHFNSFKLLCHEHISQANNLCKNLNNKKKKTKIQQKKYTKILNMKYNRWSCRPRSAPSACRTASGARST